MSSPHDEALRGFDYDASTPQHELNVSVVFHTLAHDMAGQYPYDENTAPALDLLNQARGHMLTAARTRNRDAGHPGGGPNGGPDGGLHNVERTRGNPAVGGEAGAPSDRTFIEDVPDAESDGKLADSGDDVPTPRESGRPSTPGEPDAGKPVAPGEPVTLERAKGTT